MEFKGEVRLRHLINSIQLVYPPISNQEGDWLWDLKEVREYFKSSKLYMIGHREELFFEDVTFHSTDSGLIRFKLKMGDIESPYIEYSLHRELEILVTNYEEVELEIGPKLIRIRESGNPANVITWFTPDVFLFLYWRGGIEVNVLGEFDYRSFTRFELFYVGISKKNDSFSRLFEKAHHARLKILTNAFPKNKGARITDELVIFMFDIDSININIASNIEELENDFFNNITQKEAIVADAEKAFVSLLSTKYNEVRFEKYPFGVDGLYSEGLSNYGYSLNEDITFYTESIEFEGSYGETKPGDFIFVERDKAKIIKFT